MVEALLAAVALLGFCALGESRYQTLHDGGSASVSSYVDSVMADSNLSTSDWKDYVKLAPHSPPVSTQLVDTIQLVSQNCGVGAPFDPIRCHYKIGGR